MITCTAALSWMRHDHDGAAQHQANQQDKQSTAAAAPPGQEPWRPIATEIDVIAGIQQLRQQYAYN